MAGLTHLKSLQALELAIRCGSLQAAAARLGITPAAVGQRIRALEGYLHTDLLVRGRSGLSPTPQMAQALGDLEAGFAALERVTATLDFQRISEIHVTADSDWAELWLMPRLPAFRLAHPNVLFCINGAGDIPARPAAPDIRVFYGDGEEESLFTDLLLPLSGPDNLRRFVGTDPMKMMDGMPLLHIGAQLELADHPGWLEWFRRFGQRESAHDRGLRFQHAPRALEAARREVGFLICGLSLALRDLDDGRLFSIFPMAQHLVAPHPYRLGLRQDVPRRPQVQRFLTWLRSEAGETRSRMAHLTEKP